MKHHILAKWNDQVIDKQEMSCRVKELYKAAMEVPGVEQVEVIDNCIDRPNRYDLLIRLTLPKEALPQWDASELHHRWKEEYGHLLASKAIFDCE